MEEIIILGKSIINDIRMMDKKSLDISLIQDDKSDLTFFNIDCILFSDIISFALSNFCK